MPISPTQALDLKKTDSNIRVKHIYGKLFQNVNKDACY
jgi:hypothetical protein